MATAGQPARLVAGEIERDERGATGAKARALAYPTAALHDAMARAFTACDKPALAAEAKRAMEAAARD